MLLIPLQSRRIKTAHKESPQKGFIILYVISKFPHTHTHIHACERKAINLRREKARILKNSKMRAQSQISGYHHYPARLPACQPGKNTRLMRRTNFRWKIIHTHTRASCKGTGLPNREKNHSEGFFALLTCTQF